ANAPPEEPAPEEKPKTTKPAAAPVEAKPEPQKTEPKLATQGPAIRESFDKAPDGNLPTGWAQWSDLGGTIQLSSAKAASKPNAVMMSGGSKISARAWIKDPQLVDSQASAAIFIEHLIPAQVLVRGKALDSNSPTFYAASATRGMEVKLVRVARGGS